MQALTLLKSHKREGFFYRFTKDANVDPTEVSKNGGILLVIILPRYMVTITTLDSGDFYAFNVGTFEA